ncbi:MAG: hypothetical protein ACRDSR_20925 [Pseudonocardiaceae bacterium]
MARGGTPGSGHQQAMGHWVMQLRQVQLRQVTLVQTRVHGMLHGIVGNAAASGELPDVATRTSRSN